MTGSSRGIGRATALELAAEGARVASGRASFVAGTVVSVDGGATRCP